MKENLTQIAQRFSAYLVKTSPQVVNDSLQWYLAGSLATMVLAEAESIQDMVMDNENSIIGGKEEKAISDEQRTKLQTFSRKLGQDIDVVNVNGDLFSGAPFGQKPSIFNVRKAVPDIGELMSWPEMVGGSMYIDNLDYEREIKTHPIAKARTSSGDVYLIAPPEQLAFKLHETLQLRGMLDTDFSDNINVTEHYKKDIRDVSSMYYGFHELYEKNEFSARIFEALCEKDGSIFIEDNNMRSKLGKIAADSASYISTIGDEKSASELKELFEDLLDRRRTFKLQRLQKQNAELSSLEKDAKDITIEENSRNSKEK